MTQTLSLDALEAIKEKQRTTWASGDYAMIGTTLQIVGESLCEAVDIAAGWRVLDVAAGVIRSRAQRRPEDGSTAAASRSDRDSRRRTFARSG